MKFIINFWNDKSKTVEIVGQDFKTALELKIKAGISFADANLSRANLTGANLSDADLDFSTGFSFQCSSFGAKANLRLAAQMAYHFCRFDFGDCEEAIQAQAALRALANKFHRVDGCGKI